MSILDRRPFLLPLISAGIAGLLFAGFVYGFPILFYRIEAAHPDHFAQNVMEALSRGQTDRALRIAQHAVDAPRADPRLLRAKTEALAHTMYARALFATGEPEAALAQLRMAFDIDRELESGYGATRKPFYFAPGRLTLGAYYLDQGNAVEAVAQFELARAYADLSEEPYAAFHGRLYQAYASLELWGRALEFGAPSEEEWHAISEEALLRMGYIHAGQQDWDQVVAVAHRLADRGGYTGEAEYFLGRAALARENIQEAVSHLQRAFAGGYGASAYFLGHALEQNDWMAWAIDVYRDTPPEDVSRPFSLARVLNLLPEDSGERAEVERLLRQEFTALRASAIPVQGDPYARFVPVAFRLSKPHFASGGRFPILVLWEDTQDGSEPEEWGSITFEDSEPLTLDGGSYGILRLEWVENRVYWEGVQHVPEDATEVPGWIDTARDWFKLRPESVVGIELVDRGRSALRIPRATWIYSVLEPVCDGVGYLFITRFRDPDGRGSFGRQALNERERVLFSEDIVAGQRAVDWVVRGGYVRSQLAWEAIRAQINMMPRAETILCDQMLLVALTEPDFDDMGEGALGY